MNRFLPPIAAVVACFLLLQSYPGQGQSPRGRIQNELQNRIGDQRVARQAEILRLEQMIERVQARVQRLERQSVSASQFPLFSIAESEAALRFAESRLAASQEELSNGESSELQVAADQLEVVRARGQVELARAASADRALALQSDVAFAERRLAEETQKKQQLQRMVAKGYSSTEGLDLQAIDVNLASKELQRARARLKLHEDLNGTEVTPAQETEQ